MKNILFLVFLIGQLTIAAQSNCPYYKKYIAKGDAELKKGSKADFEAAIDAYSTAMLHCPDSAEVARGKILAIFKAIEKLKTEAEKAKKQAQVALAQVKDEQEKTKVALIENENARIRLDSALNVAKTEATKLKKALNDLEITKIELAVTQKELEVFNKKLPALLDSVARTGFFTIHGQVFEQNSKKRPVSNVQIIFADALPTISDSKGKFQLVFTDKKPGDLIFLNEIIKSGYEVVNKKEFEILKISNSSNLGVDIILAKSGVVDAAKRAYYDVSDKALLMSFNKEKIKLREKLRNSQVNQKDLEDQCNTLQDEYETKKRSIEHLADKFARLNFDTVSDTYLQAFELFQSGLIDSSIQILEQTQFNQKDSTWIPERQRIELAKSEIFLRISENNKALEEVLQRLIRLSDLYILQFDYVKAEAIYDQILLLDTTNLEILQESADFYFKYQNKYDKALILYSKIKEQILDSLNRLPTSLHYQTALAITYDNIGKIYEMTGDLINANSFYQSGLKLKKELFDTNPQNMDFKNGLSISYQLIGNINTSVGNFDKALQYYEDYTRLEKELYTAYPKNVDFKNGLAISYQYLGITHTALGNLDKALTFFEERSRLGKELYAAYPKNVDFKNGLAASYQYLGLTHTALGNLVKALAFFEDYNKLEKELYAAYPKNVDFKNRLAISYAKLGETHTALGNLDKALAFFEDYNKLEKELYANYPKNVDFKNGLAISYQYLGGTHTALGNLDKALAFFEDFNKLEKELHADYPKNVKFKNGLAISYSKLGVTHTGLGNLDKALQYYEEDLQLTKELYAAYPQNVEFKNNLAVSFAKLAQFSRDQLNDKNKAKVYFRQSETLWVELLSDKPEYVDFQRLLDIVRKNLVNLEK